MHAGSVIDKLPTSTAMRNKTRFRREFKAFLAGIGFQLKHFLPDDALGLEMFPDYAIPRATGYEKLRGQGGLSEELARRWARRSNRFLQDAVEKGRTLSLDGISFIEYEGDQPKVSWKKLIALYEEYKPVALRITVNDSIDDAKVEQILAKIQPLVGNIQIVVSRVNEGSTQITILVSPEDADEILSLFETLDPHGTAVTIEQITMPPAGSIARKLWLDGPPIDLGNPDALHRFKQVWQKATRIEWIIRPWRRLRWIASLSVASSPLAGVIRDSNDRAYAFNLRGKWAPLKADIWMILVTWPLVAVLSLGIALSILHYFFPFIAVGIGIATALILALAGSQVCSVVLSPIACGAGTIVMCWAFGLAQAFAIGYGGTGEWLSRSNIRHDFFTSITGGIVGLAAPSWRGRISVVTIILLLFAIASAIAVAGWFMVQPTRAGSVEETSRRRVAAGAVLGTLAGSGIGLVRLISTTLIALGCRQHIAFIAAFASVGGAVFGFTIRLRVPRIPNRKWLIFTLAYAVAVCLLCSSAYLQAGSSLGLLALSACTGVYQATWFTAASIIGNRIGAARAAVIATTLEGAAGFATFIAFLLLQN